LEVRDVSNSDCFGEANRFSVLPGDQEILNEEVELLRELNGGGFTCKRSSP
jgi:hypothetical protein